MKFDCKLYFVGLENRHSSKTGKDYTVIKLFDYDSNSSFEVFTSSPEVFKDFKVMQQYSFNLQISKQNELINLRLVE